MTSIVLLSSGLDSTVNLFKAKKSGTVKLAITFDYGQKAARKEIQVAKKICKELKVNHIVIRLPFFKDFSQSSLIVKKLQIPTAKQVQINNFRKSKQTAKSVWVPNRNGIFLNIAAGFAESLKADYIVPGFNLEEAKTFPDNSTQFIHAMNRSLYFSTANHVKVKCFTKNLHKRDIVLLGNKLKVNWKNIWPCYFAKKKWCGVCESCLRSKNAFKIANVNVKNFFME